MFFASSGHAINPLALVIGLAAGVACTAAAPAAGTAYPAGTALDAGPQPDAQLPAAKDMLTWNQHERVIGFRNIYRMYPGDTFHTLGVRPFPLPPAGHKLPALVARDGQRIDFDDYVRRQSVTGMLILKNGRIVHEYYGAGNTDRTLWTSRSVAKSVVSILVGMAIKEGFIHSVADPITRYLPELEGSAWQSVSLRNLLQHTSGVAWNENYADPSSDFAQMTRCEAGDAAYPCILHLVATLQRRPGVAPGEVWSYNTGGAWLCGLLLERATGMTLAHYLETRLWSRFGMQSDGVWEALVKDHVDMGGHGFNATLRDWGRFGLFVSRGGRDRHGQPLLPSDWIAQSVTWTRARGSVTPATPDGQYGYQWWFGGVDPAVPFAADIIHDAKHTFWAEGIYGQAIAIDPPARLVMVQWSTWKDAEGPSSLYDDQVLFFDALRRALRPGIARPARSRGADRVLETRGFAAARPAR
jgi:CubicO group peptidase (beta-lactamase class C family)